MRKGFLNVSEPLIVSDSGATSNCGKMKDPFILMGIPSGSAFNIPLGQVTEVTEQIKLMHMVREQARTANMVPGLK